MRTKMFRCTRFRYTSSGYSGSAIAVATAVATAVAIAVAIAGLRTYESVTLYADRYIAVATVAIQKQRIQSRLSY